MDVDQHVEAARQITVEATNVRRRSLCVQDAFKMSPDPQYSSTGPPPRPYHGFDEHSSHTTGSSVDHNHSTRTEQPFSNQPYLHSSGSSATTTGGPYIGSTPGPPYLALNPRSPLTNNGNDDY